MTPPDSAAIPFYFEWEFWTALVAFLALVLSQLPPLYSLFRRGKLKLEAYERLNLSHLMGNSNAQLHLIVMNEGGRPVRVKQMTLTFRREAEPPWELKGRGYYQSIGDASAVLLTPFTIGARQEWAHTVNFITPLSRQDEQRLRQLQSALRNDIQTKKALPENADSVVEAAPNTLNPVLAFYQQKFKWEPGEYAVTVTIITEPSKATLTKAYRMTLFESDAADLRSYRDEYKYGLGVYFFNGDRQPGILPALTET